MIKLYGVPNCKQITQTKEYFASNKIDYEFINVKKEPVPAKQLREVIRQLGHDKVINKKGLTYRKLGLKEKNLTPEEEFSYLLEEQGMIKRPLIEKEGRYWIGFDPERMKSFLK